MQHKIILASNSPRRRELLEALGLTFEVRVAGGIDESYPEDLNGKDVALYISKKKAAAYRNSMAEDELIITADTIVCVDNDVLGKPHSRQEAYEMLRLISGRSHEVVTGVVLTTKERQKAFAVSSSVVFANLSDEEIYHYIDNYHPMDKAGAYGIQEWIGMIGVEELRGSFFNVMGLPVQRLYRELKAFENE